MHIYYFTASKIRVIINYELCNYKSKKHILEILKNNFNNVIITCLAINLKRKIHFFCVCISTEL